MFNFLCEVTENTADGKTRVVLIIMLAVVIFGMLVMPYITQRKQNNNYLNMINNLRVGDLIKTAGGIIGRIVKILDKGEIKTIILETGSKTEKSYMEFDITSILCILQSTKAEDEVETEEEIEENIANTAENAEENSVEEIAENKIEEPLPAENPITEQQVVEEDDKTKKSKTALAKKTKKSAKK